MTPRVGRHFSPVAWELQLSDTIRCSHGACRRVWTRTNQQRKDGTRICPRHRRPRTATARPPEPASSIEQKIQARLAELRAARQAGHPIYEIDPWARRDIMPPGIDD